MQGVNIDDMKEHIQDIRSRLKAEQFSSETAVRQGIIDRLLINLGWSTFDPESVYPEYPIGSGRAGYALCYPAKSPIVLIEVKRVGNIEGAERQLFEYAFYQGIPILVLTDGQKWRFFHPTGSGDYTEHLVHEFDILHAESQEVASRLQRYLKYTLVQRGEAMRNIAEDYQNVYRNREILRCLPQAWDNLTSGESEDSASLIAAVKSEVQRLSGNDPPHEQVFTFLKNLGSQTQLTPIDVPSASPETHPKRGLTKRGERYTAYFQALVDELREQHNFTKSRRTTKGENCYYFSSGFSGIWYKAQFMRQGRVFIGLYIGFLVGKEKNKNFFDILKKRESEINAKFNAPLYWDRGDQKQSCSVGFLRAGNINTDRSQLASLKAWQIENLLKFKEVFTPEIQLALEKLRSSEIEAE